MIVDQTLSAVEMTLYIAPCSAMHVLTYDDAPLVVSRYVSRYLDHDTIRVSSAQVSRCIDVSLRPYWMNTGKILSQIVLYWQCTICVLVVNISQIRSISHEIRFFFTFSCFSRCINIARLNMQNEEL